MSNYNQALFRVDPTQALIDYVNVVKPYHSKILDVNIQYLFEETITTAVRSSHDIEVTLLTPIEPVNRTNGFGDIWSPDQQDNTPQNIYNLVGYIEHEASFITGDATITIT